MIPWIQQTEVVVSRNYPILAEVVNRPLRYIVTQSGLNPDTWSGGLVALSPGFAQVGDIHVTGTITADAGISGPPAASADKWTTPRLLAGNSVDGSANVPFANKFIVQGVADAGLTNAQFLGALATGILKNTVGSGVLSIAAPGDFPVLNQNTTGSAAFLNPGANINGVLFTGLANIIVTAAAGTLTGNTLAANVVNSSLTSVGVLTSLIVAGDAIVGKLLISTAASRIVPGLTSLSFLNHAETLTNVLIEDSGLVTFSKDIIVNTLGRFDSTVAPTRDQLLSYNGTKWIPRTVQLAFSSGVIAAGNLADATAVSYAFAAPAYPNATPAVPSVPVLVPVYGGMIVYIGAYPGSAPPANTSYVIDYSVNGGAYTVDAIITTGSAIVHSLLDPTKTYAYKVKGRGKADGTFDSAYSAPSAATNPSSVTEVNPFGLIVASQISTINLAAISATLGIIVAGRIDNLAAAPTAGIRISSGYSKPGTWTRYLDLAAAGANPFLKHETLSLNADGTATFTGNVEIDLANAHFYLIDPNVAHGVTDFAPTTVYGSISESQINQGGLIIQGFHEGAGNLALHLEGYTVGGGGSIGNVVVSGWEKSGTGRIAPTTGRMFTVRAGTGELFRVFTDRLETTQLLKFSAIDALIQADAGKSLIYQVNGVTKFLVGPTGALTLTGTPAFTAGAKYLVLDAGGNVQVSALGPAS